MSQEPASFEKEAGSALIASGSFAEDHFQLYYVYPYLLSAFGAVEGKPNEDSIRIHFRPGLAAANGTMNP